jgi:HSP20 family molecular chaperone IbpA
MFKRKNCPKCNEKVNEKYSFCPTCGFNLSKNQNKEKEYGMLGQNDYLEQDPFNMDNMLGSMFTGIGGRAMNNMFNNAIKMLEKEMQKSMKEQQKFQNQNQPINRTNFELYINGKRVSPDKIKVTNKPNHYQNNQKHNNKRLVSKEQMSRIGTIHPNQVPKFSNESKQNFQKLPKKQPETNVRRFSDKVIYEINVPGVESIKDVSISQMENSIEIRAVSKKNAYEKIIPIGLPIIKYGLSNGKIVLELKEE